MQGGHNQIKRERGVNGLDMLLHNDTWTDVCQLLHRITADCRSNHNSPSFHAQINSIRRFINHSS